MRRTLATAAALLALVAGVVALTGASSGDDGLRYRVELDNAFGLIEGADLKVAGVRAGKVVGMTLDRTDMRALVEVEVTQNAFGGLKRNATCETRPQSLIGEYFVDCKPGTGAALPDGGLVPVTQTASTVPVDLVNNIMRRPVRERFSIILGELGAGLTARGGDLNDTIRRASPALREVDRVLAILREQRTTIRDLYGDADRVVGALAGNREDVGRFVEEARDTAAVGAARPAAVRRQLRGLATALAELQETMPLLGRAAERQAGAVRTLRAQAPLLRRFLGALGPFAEASRPAVRTLGEAAEVGSRTMPAFGRRLAELAKPAKGLPELTTNLAMVLEHLDDRANAVEPDARTPGGKGVTGYEALLRYVFAQSQATNLVDSDNYILKVAAFLDADCAFVQNAETARTEKQQRCAAVLGPGRIGVTSPDPTATSQPAARRRTSRAPRRETAPQREAAPAPAAPQPRDDAPAGDPRPGLLDQVPEALPPAVRDLLEDVLGGRSGGSSSSPSGLLPGLDFLLGP